MFITTTFFRATARQTAAYRLGYVSVRRLQTKVSEYGGTGKDFTRKDEHIVVIKSDTKNRFWGKSQQWPQTWVRGRVDTKWRFQFCAKYDYRFLLDAIIAIIATFFAKAIIAIS